MKYISSRDNALYKQLLRLASGRHSRDAANLVLLEGLNLCKAWLQHHGTPVRAVFDAERLDRGGQLRALAEAVGDAASVACEPRLARGLSQVESGQGIYFMVEAPRPDLPEHIDHNCLWLDRIQDPGNVGTLLRTAAAAGIRHAYLSTGTCAAWSPKVLRSAQGAHFAMTLHEQVDLAAAHERLTVPLAATLLEGGEPLFDVPLPERCAWLMGNEGQGTSPALAALAQLRVYVPQAPHVESLNVAAAAAICLFEQRRRWLGRAAQTQ